jgi:hypothetical protein
MVNLKKYRYARIVEDQRRLVHQKRTDILIGPAALALLEKEKPENYKELKYGGMWSSRPSKNS